MRPVDCFCAAEKVEMITVWNAFGSIVGAIPTVPQAIVTNIVQVKEQGSFFISIARLGFYIRKTALIY
jgi:hypothetical protein